MSLLTAIPGGATMGLRFDPVLSHHFIISLIDTSSSLGLLKSIAISAVFDIALGGFTECSGLEMSMDPEEHEAGGLNSNALIFPSRIKWGNITLKKGVGASTALWDWHYDYAEGKGTRRDGLIMLLNDLHIPNNIWYFSKGLPVKYTGPSMNARQSEVSIESIEIAHEGIYQVPFVGAAAAAAMSIAELVT